MAMKEIPTGHVPSVDKPEDVCTRFIPDGANWKHLIGKVLHELYEK